MMASLQSHGYQIIENIYSPEEVDAILAAISQAGVDNKFGVREFLTDHPEITELVFTDKLLAIVKSVVPERWSKRVLSTGES